MTIRNDYQRYYRALRSSHSWSNVSEARECCPQALDSFYAAIRPCMHPIRAKYQLKRRALRLARFSQYRAYDHLSSVYLKRSFYFRQGPGALETNADVKADMFYTLFLLAFEARNRIERWNIR